MNLQGNKITWLGHATFRIETRDLITIYIDPWLSNPLCPEDEKRVKKCDVMICTHGHGDHIGDAVRIANELNPMVVGIFELCAWLQKKGAKQTSPMNKGGTQTVGGIKITMTHAVHSCGIEDDDGSMVYGGEACGYVLELPGGVRLYHAGDTAVFGDMQIIHQLYAPEIAMLPIGDHSPWARAKPLTLACCCSRRRSSLCTLVHFHMLTGRPGELKKLLGPGGPEILEMKPGQTLAKQYSPSVTVRRQVAAS